MPSAWKYTTNPLPQASYMLRSWHWRGRVYICSGLVDASGNPASALIHAAKVQPDGDLGPWEIVGQLSAPVGAAGFAFDDSAGIGYLGGGYGPSFVRTAGIQRLHMNGDGTVSVVRGGSFPTSVYDSAMTSVSGVLVVGGDNSYNAVTSKKIFTSVSRPVSEQMIWRQQISARDSLSEEALASCRGLLFSFVQPGNAGNPGYTLYPMALDYVQVSPDGSIPQGWKTAGTISGRYAIGACGFPTGVILGGGSQSADNTTFVDLKEVWFIPVGTDRQPGKPVQLPSLKVARSDPALVSDGRFVWCLGGDDGTTFAPIAGSNVEVLDCRDLLL